MDLTLPCPDVILNVRVAAVVVASDGRLLLQGDPRFDFLVPPGGRCRLNEDTRAALQRELTEELGPGLTVGRMLWIIENFFTLEGRRYHEFTFVYRATLDDKPAFLARGDRFDFTDGGNALFFTWVPPDALPGLTVYPEVLRTRAHDLPAGIEHLVVHTVS